ncbi:MAG TPA: hypothetical protein PK340_05830 [Bacilli bacterium]|nr:hypothetical protein [Bacilli bacterium]
MKTRNKLLLSASAMLVLSAGAMVTGTVAWFTATRQLNVNFSNVTVMSTQGDLDIALVPQSGYTEDDGTPGQIDIEYAATTTDISGDGITFYKPEWNIDYTAAIAMEDVTNLTNFPGYYVDFQLTISRTNTGPNDGFLVYLGDGSAVVPASSDPEDVAAANSVRVAILDEAKAVRKVLWAADDGDATYEYIAAEALATFEGLNGYEAKDAELLSDFVEGDFVLHDEISGLTHIGGNSPEIADLTKTVGDVAITEEIVTVRIWHEGTDVDSDDAAKLGQYSIVLDFYSMGF